jgi:hypothetical protein
VNSLGGVGAFRKELLQRLKPRNPIGVLILQADAEAERQRRSGYGYAGVRLEEEYLQRGFQVIRRPLRIEWLSELGQGARPSVAHISAAIGESFVPREVYLTGGDSGEPIRTEALSRVFAAWPENQLRPFVILDIVDNPFDAGRTLLLRNAFAAHLFLEATRGVLAIGPYPSDSLSRIIRSFIMNMGMESAAIADLHTRLWSLVGNPRPSLFTLDPDLPVWD